MWGRCLSEPNLISGQLIHECFNVMVTSAFLPSVSDFLDKGNSRKTLVKLVQTGSGLDKRTLAMRSPRKAMLCIVAGEGERMHFRQVYVK